jgi:hypothetical protein
MSNTDRLKFAESLEKQRKDRDKRDWALLHNRLCEQLARDRERHAAVYRARAGDQ